MSVEIYLFFWHINNMRKEKQLKIILKYNPCPDEYHTTDYAAGGNVYSKFVNIDYVAWVDVTQGQYASVALTTNSNNKYE